MCGRYLLTSAPEAVRAIFGYKPQPNFPPRYNIAPTQPVPVVSADHDTRSFRLMRWGFIPSWVKDPSTFSLVINARAETVLEKPSFRAAIRHRRCLVPADGYYEWQASARGKQPYLVTPAGGGLVAFAGLCETWTGPNGEEMDSVAIITVPANEALAWLHARMPAVIAPADFDNWLDCVQVDAREAVQMLRPAPDDLFEVRPVSPQLNRADREGAALIAPYETAPEPEPAKKAKSPTRAPRKAASGAAKEHSKASGKLRAKREQGQGSLF